MGTAEHIGEQTSRLGDTVQQLIAAGGFVSVAQVRHRHTLLFRAVVVAVVVVPAPVSLLVATSPSGPRPVLLAVLVVHPVLTVGLVLWAALRGRAAAPDPLRSRVEIAVTRAQLRQDAATLHQVRSMVAAISLAARVLEGSARRTVSSVTRTDLVDMQRREIGRLERLVCDDGRGGDPGTTDLDEILEPLVVTLQARGTQVHWQRTGAIAQGASDDISEVVQVLLENAERHAPGSPVLLDVAASYDAVSIRVTDHGSGVAVDDRARVFDWGVHQATSPGRGIGLSAARDRAWRAHGTLVCEEGPTGGASFTLRLRPAPGQAAEACSALEA